VHQADKSQFERASREFTDWRAVPEKKRSPAPAWWWQAAFIGVAKPAAMYASLAESN
jgi:pentapeptide MXKDX repeat protein